MKRYNKNREEIFKSKLVSKTSNIIRIFNDVLNNTNTDKFDVCIFVYWINKYMHSSYRYSKQNWDGTYLNVQPGWPDKTVISFSSYYDKSYECAHKASRLVVVFDDNTETEISLYKFKRYLRKQFQVCGIR